MLIPESNKHEIEELLGELEQRKRFERLRYFEPTSSTRIDRISGGENPQDKVLASKAKIRAVFGGNRASKTEIMAADCAYSCLGRHPYRPTTPPIYGRVCAPKYEDGCKGVILKKFRQLIPRKDLLGESWDTSWKESSKTLTFANGSQINFKSGEQDLNTYGGDDLDFFWMDEHLQEKYFLENMARITDRNGWGLLSMTPEAGQTWEKDFVESPPPGISVEYWYFDTEKNPYLSKEGIEAFKATLTDPRVRDAKLHGYFVTLTGMVYPSYDKSKLIVPDFDIPKKWGRTLVIDPHMRKPTALLWLAWDGDRPVVYRAKKVKLPVPELSKFIRAESAGERIDLFLADEAMGGKGKNIYGETSVIEQLVAMGLPFMGTNQSSDKAFEAGVSKVTEYITLDPITGIMPMKIFQSCDWGVQYIDGKRCGSLFWEFERYRFRKEQKSDEENFREKVANVDDDLLDALRYGLMAGPPTGGESVVVVSSANDFTVDAITGW